MQSEDGAFFYHRGFLPDALREALIYDLQVKRFARGGSTITMQLVKNVFPVTYTHLVSENHIIGSHCYHSCRNIRIPLSEIQA